MRCIGRCLFYGDIAAKLGYSFKTVCLDIKWFEENANEEIREQQRNIALEYIEALDVFRYLKRKALEQFERAEKERNEDRMEGLDPIIQSINVDLIDLQNQSDLIKAEVLLQKKDKAESLKEDLDKVIESDKAVL